MLRKILRSADLPQNDKWYKAISTCSKREKNQKYFADLKTPK